MIKIELKKENAQQVLAMRTRTTMDLLSKTIGEGYTKIMNYMKELGEEALDAPYTAYYNMDMQDIDVEMGFPVSKQLPEKGEIKSIEIPEGMCVSAMYKGPYSAMEQPYNEILKWIDDNGHEKKGVYYEYYYNSPADVPESELLTKIVIPLK